MATPYMRCCTCSLRPPNPFQLMVLHQMLNTFRIFDVLVAENLDSARRSLAQRGAIDVAICDLYVEGLTGLDLIRELAVRREASALIILSCAAPHIVEKAVRTARSEGLRVLGCLAKPVTVNGLGQLLDAYRSIGAYASDGGAN
ncbi:response regulator [Pseudomonas taetrolens]|uniref:response regulator n=1 Tax=Pseudomonas taetrolens TaxID=47884 RepID=UPI003F948065